jgi:tetratricopeptide (TPR) repeat protein
MAVRIQQEYAQAVQFLEARRPLDALPLLRSCAKAAPSSGAIQVTLATCLLDAGETISARTAFEHMLGNAQFAEQFAFQIHGNLAQLHSECGAAKQAIQHYEKALGLEDDWFEGHYNVANLLSDLGSEFEAKALYHYACAVKHEEGKLSADAHNNYGVCLQNAGRLDKARSECALACALDPKHASAHFNLSSCCQQSGLMEQAIKYCTKALSLNPDYHQAHAQMAVLLNESGNPLQALPYFLKAMELVNNSGANDNKNVAQPLDDTALHYGLMRYFTLRRLSCDNNLSLPPSSSGGVENRNGETQEALERRACEWAREIAEMRDRRAENELAGSLGKEIASIDIALLYILAGEMEKAADSAKTSDILYLGLDKCSNIMDMPISKLGLLCQKCSLFSGVEELTHKAKLARNLKWANELTSISPESHVVDSLGAVESIITKKGCDGGEEVWYLKDPHMQRGQGIHIFKTNSGGSSKTIEAYTCMF